MLMPNGLTPQEIRILQEFRRVGAEELPLDQIKAVKHPAGDPEAPVWTLAEKGYLAADDSRQMLSLTEEARAFLSYNPEP
ncbi:MAG TPA: hypothetical protein VMS12_12430 [Thermoanaerobaculia bacterium]|nr:hypothetical protein [Thermoanaerobaculia bacterium]